MTARTVIAWLVAAVLGLALAAGITVAASQLSSQRVGLSGEPLSAGDRLAPRTRPRPPQARPTQRRPSHPSQPSRPSQPSQPSQGDDGAGGDD
jgi:hypothetical protein